MKVKLIIICLLIFGCKTNQEPTIVEKIGYLTTINGGEYKLETDEGETIWENGEKTYGNYEVYVNDYNISQEDFFGPYAFKLVKVSGELKKYWHTIPSPPYDKKVYRVRISVKSIELAE